MVRHDLYKKTKYTLQRENISFALYLASTTNKEGERTKHTYRISCLKNKKEEITNQTITLMH